LDEQNFLATCDRSGQCVTACHQDSILPLTIPFGPDLVGTPAIIPEIRACFVCEDVPCVYACPSGALAKITVAELRLGTAVLDQSRCLVTAGESCSACIDACPKPGDAIFATDATIAPIINPSSCTGCGMCVPACPVQPGAIRVHPAWAIEV
jgi:MauM/NapG family ferredoxin protein